MEKLAPRAQERVCASEEVQQDANFVARKAVMFAAAMAVFGVKSEADAQGRGSQKSGKKPVAAEAIYLSCPEQEAARVEGENVTVSDECVDGRLEVRCPRPNIAAAWDIPSMPLPGGFGVSMPLRLLRGGSIFVRCEGDPKDGGRILDISPVLKTSILPQADSTQVKEHPEVKAAEVKYLAAKQRLVEAEKQMIRTGRDLLSARGKLDSARKRFELKGAATSLIGFQAAEEEYMRVMRVRQQAKTEYEAAQAEFDRSVEQFSATVQHVLAGLKLAALREPPARAPDKTAKPKVKTSPPAVSRAASSSPLQWSLSAGASRSLRSAPYDLVGSPGFSLEADMRGVFRNRPSLGIQIAASYASVSRPLSSGDSRFVSRDPSRRLDGMTASLSARIRRDFQLGRIGPADADFRGSVGFGGSLVRTERGVDVGVSRKNGRDLADIPESTTVLPMTAAGAHLVLTRDRIFTALGVSGTVSVFPIQGKPGSQDAGGSLLANGTLDVLLGYKF